MPKYTKTVAVEVNGLLVAVKADVVFELHGSYVDDWKIVDVMESEETAENLHAWADQQSKDWHQNFKDSLLEA